MKHTQTKMRRIFSVKIQHAIPDKLKTLKSIRFCYASPGLRLIVKYSLDLIAALVATVVTSYILLHIA